MTLAFIATVLSAICMALMIVADKLMLGDCYNGKPNHAWFVSSIAGASFGLLLTLGIWITIATLSTVGSFQTILTASIDLFLWEGVLIMIAGVCGVQILFHYFHCFSEDAHSASIASWIAATPIFIFGATALLICIQDLFDVHIIRESSITIHPLFIIGAITATVGLVAFESVSNQVIKNMGKYRKDLVLMLTFNVITIILLQQVLVAESDYENTLYILALLPYYWIGFLAGVRIMFPKKERISFVQNWRQSIRFSVRAVLFVEVIGMLVFYFEYFGLSKLDPTYVSIIVGSHIFLVYFIDILFVNFAAKMRTKKEKNIKILGLQISIDNLPNTQKNGRKKVYEWCAIAITVLGIILTSLYLH